MTFLTMLGAIEYYVVSDEFQKGKQAKRYPSHQEFLEKFLTNNFAFSEAEDNTSGPLNRGGIADLPLLKTLLAIRQKSREPNFWEVMDFFVLVAYASLAASRALLQRLLTFRNLIQIQKIYSIVTNEKNDFYKLWQQRKLLKTMEMSEASPDT